MTKIKLEGHPGDMTCALTNIPAFPGEKFTFGYPEAIGDVAAPFWFWQIKPTWEPRADGMWVSNGEQSGELAYAMTVTAEEDVVTTRFKLTNHSSRTWSQGMAFNCFQCAKAPSIRDHDCLRHWVRTGGKFTRLWNVPRVLGPRPALQLYNVENAPLARDLPFVANFQSTPDTVIEPWMAIVSRDGKRLVATVSKPGLFLFQNREYSCIHCGAGFGELKPGQTAEALNKVYFVKSTLEQWHERMTRELSAAVTQGATTKL